MQSPSPTASGATAAPTEPPPAPSIYLANTWHGIHAFQPFDNFNNKNIIPTSQAQADGPRYVAIWGSNTPQMVAAWKTNNPSIKTSYYIPIGTDALPNQFGNLGNSLSWWQANHPDWILYECDKTTVAHVENTPEIPLDISNQAVVDYIVHLTADYAEQNGYAAIGADFADVNNITGGQNGGTHGCGVWTTQNGNQVWVQKFSGQSSDPAWAAAAINWMSTMHAYVHGLPRPMALWGNQVPGLHPYGNAQEQQVLSYLDIVDDEAGYSRYGTLSNDSYFNATVSWARYVQARGQGFFSTALYHVPSVTDAQLEYAIAGYLMSKEQASALTTDPYGTYGIEHFYPAYNANVGKPCNEMYGGPGYNGLGQYVYYRQYTHALAIFNTHAVTYNVTLPRNTYTDAVTGTQVTSPLAVAPQAGYVLLTGLNGCTGSANVASPSLLSHKPTRRP